MRSRPCIFLKGGSKKRIYSCVCVHTCIHASYPTWTCRVVVSTRRRILYNVRIIVVITLRTRADGTTRLSPEEVEEEVCELRVGFGRVGEGGFHKNGHD